MRAKEFIIEDAFNGIDISIEVEDDQIMVKATSNGRELGHVLFVVDGEYLMPQDLEVDERYRGQGIAATMYDYVKSKGYKIRRSGQQTDAGAGFWAKHRPEQNVWEQSVAESLTQDRNLSPITKKYIKDHAWKLTTVNPMSLDIDSFDDPFNRVIDIDTDYQVDFKQPIIVHANGTTIIDGFHRAYQAQIQGLKQIPAYVPVKQDVTESPSVAQEIKEFINSLTPDDVGVEVFPGYRVHFEGFTDDCKSSSDYQQDPDAVYQQVYQDFVDREHGQKPVKSGMAGSEEYPVLYSVFRVEQGVSEAFDQPYKGKWEKSDYGDVDMLVKLPDGTNLSIMFNQEYGDEGEEVVQVEFYRNNSQDVTGEGDAQRIFATVLDAIQKYIKKYKPQRLSFSASKAVDMDADDNSAQFNPESRAKLYDRLVQRYSKALGYRAFRADNGDIVIYELSRIKQGVAEGTSKTIPRIGINVRNDGDIDYASLIVDGKKKYESRKTDSLRPYVGKTVGIVRTGNGPAVAIGQVTIGEPIVVNAEKFDLLRKKHLVPKGSKFDIDSNGTKYLYPMINPVRWDNEKLIKHKGIVSRKIQESMKVSELLEQSYINQSNEGGNLEGYVVDSDKPQLTNYLTSQGADKNLINQLKQKYKTIAIIRNMYVGEEQRGQGYGNQLVSDAIDDAAGNHANAIICVADMSEDNAIDLVKWYENFGFEVVGKAGSDPVMVLEL